ncbi:homeobox protein 2-like [Lucilia cuprina]|uniref:homeobox protein 2-like n=1 Tax=Lucilia cuprina TaxID=7375 RepID=UPI001F05BE15|nr:homeobox protein 2-like [Lucilia cuprina]
MSAATLCFWQNSSTAAATAAQTSSMPDSTTSPTNSTMILTPDSPSKTLQIKQLNKSNINFNQNKTIINTNNNNSNNIFPYNNNNKIVDWEMQNNGISQTPQYAQHSNSISSCNGNNSNNYHNKKNNHIIVLDDKQQRDQHHQHTVGLFNSVRLIGGYDANDVADVDNQHINVEGDNAVVIGDDDDTIDGLATFYCNANDAENDNDHIANINDRMLVDQEVARSHQLLRNLSAAYVSSAAAAVEAGSGSGRQRHAPLYGRFVGEEELPATHRDVMHHRSSPTSSSEVRAMQARIPTHFRDPATAPLRN